LSNTFRLVTGRTREQAEGLHLGKDTEAYRRATELVEMSSDDMASLGIEDGASVELRTASGRVEVTAHTGDLPPGLLFMPLGFAANCLIDAETGATGTPSYKGLEVAVTPVGSERRAAANG